MGGEVATCTCTDRREYSHVDYLTFQLHGLLSAEETVVPAYCLNLCLTMQNSADTGRHTLE